MRFWGDHYPRLKADGGHLVPWNVRLAHVLCNREDFGWRLRIRRMLAKGMSLEEIAETLNHKRVRRPHGSATWSASTVRKAFVS
jgi:DNA-binding transcriptional MerR regulator